MLDKRTPFVTMVYMVQSVGFLSSVQSQVMGAAKRVSAIEMQDDCARDRALAGLSIKQIPK